MVCCFHLLLAAWARLLDIMRESFFKRLALLQHSSETGKPPRSTNPVNWCVAANHFALEA
jgi:hypothetical protein